MFSSIALLFTLFRRRAMTLRAAVSQGQFPEFSDTKAVHMFGSAFKSELERLKNAHLTVESGTAKPAGSLENGETPSRHLFREDFAEVNRTVVNMLALKWILAGDYDTFTACQREEGKLSKGSFRRLCDFFRGYRDIYALLVAVVVDDLGKDPQLAREVAERRSHGHGHDSARNAKMVNHSDFLYQAAKTGMIPALKSASEAGRKAIISSMEIEGQLSIAQLVQGENVPASLSILKHIQDDGSGFRMRAMVTILDVAGAAAHSNARGCLVMTENIFQGYMTTIETLQRFIQDEIPSERACYDQVLTDRAKSLHSKGCELLSTDNAEQRTLLRIFCIGRVDSKQLADAFTKSFTALPVTEKNNLVQGLNVDGLNDGTAILPYYAPGLTAEVLRGVRRKEEPVLVEALSAFLRFLARVMEESKAVPNTSGVIERDLSFVQDVIKSSSFKDDPHVLDEVQLPWRQ